MSSNLCMFLECYGCMTPWLDGVEASIHLYTWNVWRWTHPQLYQWYSTTPAESLWGAYMICNLHVLVRVSVLCFTESYIDLQMLFVFRAL